MTKIHKLTLVVHPFNEIKPTERDSLEIIKGVGYKSLSQDPFLTCDDPEGQLTKSGWSPETANFCRKNFQPPFLYPLLPPQSAVMSISFAFG